jgi:23S rRNA (adenine2503-C2)-methyltransferase
MHMPRNPPKGDLRELSPAEFDDWMLTRGHQRYRADQILDWLYKKTVNSFREMGNLPPALRRELEAGFTLYSLKEAGRAVSEDGAVKLACELFDGEIIESVWMPEGKRATVCVSTQAGCRMACRFCGTGRAGFRRQLAPSEITGQVIAAAAMGTVTGIVFMGMGEPLDNLESLLKSIEILCDKRALAFAPRRLTVSTIGIIAGIEALSKSPYPVNLAVSLHSAVPKTRASLMPAAAVPDLSALKSALRKYPLGKGRKITLEMALLGSVNDSVTEARAFARWLAGLKAKVNLIPFNSTPGSSFKRPSEKAVLDYQETLRKKGIKAFIRKSRGRDVCAACGQLRAKIGVRST